MDRLSATDSVIKLMDEGKIDYIVYTGKTDLESINDFIRLHHHAILLGITVLTALDTANALAEKGFAENGWAERVTLRTGDLRENAALPAAGSMDYALSNPPYFPAGSGASAAGEARQGAREEVGCTLADVCAAAARVLRWGGRFALVHRPERLSDLFCTLRAHGLEPKRLRFVASSAENAPSLALVEARRGGKAGLSVEPMLFIGSADWDEVYFRT